MEITFDKKDNASALLTIELAQADYQPDYKAKIKDYSRRAHIKGFRPGKVPVELVEKMYGNALRSEAISQVVNQSVDKYLRENGIDVLGDLISDETQIPSETENLNESLKFSFLMAIRPEISYPSIEGMTIELPEIQIDEQKITNYIEDLRNRYGKMNEVDTIERDDFIHGKLVAADGLFETESAIPFGRIKEGYVDQFLGKKVGDVIEFPIEEAFETADIKYITNTFKDKDRSFSGMYSLTISKIERRIPAEMNQEFFELAAGPDNAGSEEDFRNYVRSLFADTYQKESMDYFAIKLENTLYNEAKFDLAEDVISKVIRNRAKGKMQDAEIEDFIPRYIRSMRMSLIRGKVAEDNQIQLSEEDLRNAAMKQIAADFQSMGYGNLGDEFLEKYADNYLNEKGKDNRERMAEKALTARIAQLVLEKGNIVRKPVSIEDYNRLVEELS